MTRVTVGVVFHTDCNQVDEILELLRQFYDIELVHVQQSYGKLWIKKGEP